MKLGQILHPFAATMGMLALRINRVATYMDPFSLFTWLVFDRTIRPNTMCSLVWHPFFPTENGFSQVVATLPISSSGTSRLRPPPNGTTYYGLIPTL